MSPGGPDLLGKPLKKTRLSLSTRESLLLALKTRDTGHMTRNLGPQPFNCRPGLRPSGPIRRAPREDRSPAHAWTPTRDLGPQWPRCSLATKHPVKPVSLWQGAWWQWETHTDPQDSEALTWGWAAKPKLHGGPGGDRHQRTRRRGRGASPGTGTGRGPHTCSRFQRNLSILVKSLKK